MRLFIHVGPHKTGTTALQYFLYTHRADMEKHGIVYPEVCFYHYAQHRLAFSLKGMWDPSRRDRPLFDQEMKDFFSYIECHCKGKDVIISSEEFFSAKKEKVDMLKDQLLQGQAFDQVQIFIFLRRPDELLVSIYNQMVKEPQNTFSKDIEEFIETPQSLSPDMSLCYNLGNWVDAFGHDNVVVKFVEQTNPVHYFKSVLESYGLKIEKKWEAYRANTSVPYPVIELMKFAKRNQMKVERRRRLYELATRLFNEEKRMEIGRDARETIVRRYEACLTNRLKELGIENPYTVDRLDFPAQKDMVQGEVEKYLARVMESLMEEKA